MANRNRDEKGRYVKASTPAPRRHQAKPKGRWIRRRINGRIIRQWIPA